MTNTEKRLPARFLALASCMLGTVALSSCNDADTGAASPASDTAMAEGEFIESSVHMQLTAYAALDDAMAGSLDEAQIAMLKSVGHQIAVAHSCEGFEIDQNRLAQEMSLIHLDESGADLELTQNELHEREKKALLGLGMTVGSQMAVAAMDTPGFCTVAEQDRAAMDQDEADYLIWAPAAAG